VGAGCRRAGDRSDRPLGDGRGRGGRALRRGGSSRPGDRSGASASAPASAPQRASAAAAPVTEWAVAPIPGAPTPGADGGPSAQFAVDDEPEEASVTPARTLTLAREGDVLTDADAPLTAEEEEELPPPVAVDAPIPPRAPVAVERPASVRPPQRTGKGIERVGEAVVRQMLGATFVREEPYTPPTRFN
ncbi:MAG: DNA polymerase III subunit gamma and tau, partial [Microbacterium sp.]